MCALCMLVQQRRERIEGFFHRKSGSNIKLISIVLFGYVFFLCNIQELRMFYAMKLIDTSRNYSVIRNSPKWVDKRISSINFIEEVLNFLHKKSVLPSYLTF